MPAGTTDYQGFAHRDVVIEAVFEDLALKQRMVSEVEQYGGPPTTLSSHTSFLPNGGIVAHPRPPGVPLCGITSTSGIFSTGLKKCRPITCPGRLA